MNISLKTIILIFILNFFIIGIKRLSIYFFFKEKIFVLKNKAYEFEKYTAITSILGLLLFCIFCNIVLLIPSLLFFINNSTDNINDYVFVAKNLLQFVVLAISAIGLIDLFQLFNFPKDKENYIKHIFDNNLFIGLLISTLIYLFFSPKSIDSGIHYDTGLYHLPFINHISEYTIEPGLANLHFRYGFYSLSFFGQVPFQSLMYEKDYLSPSLNIGFLGLYISYFIPYLRGINIKSFKKVLNNKIFFEEKIYPISFLYFCLSIIFFTGGIFKSLSSYSVDLPLFICGSLGFHLLILSFIDHNKYNYYISIFWLSFFGPVIKLTGIVIPLFYVVFLSLKIIYLLNQFKKDNPRRSLNYLLRIFQKKLLHFFDHTKNHNYKSSFFLVFIVTLTVITTNVVISGYAFYPSNLIGSFHSYSVDQNLLDMLIGGTKDWFRYQNNTLKTLPWFIGYLITRNGIINILLWFIPCTISIFLFRRIYKLKSTIDLSSLLFSIITIIFICFFNLIPAVNYYPWIPHFIVFLMLIIINRTINYFNININFAKYTLFFLTLFIIFNSFFSYSNSLIIKNISLSMFKEPILMTPEFNEFQIKPKRWKSFSQGIDSKNVKVLVPKNNDQCWGLEPPCAASSIFLNEI